MILFAITRHNGIRIAELGFLLAAAGGVSLALGSLLPFAKRFGTLVGGLALASGGVLLVVATHSGHFG